MYVLYKFTVSGKSWIKDLSDNGTMNFTEHQTDAMHFKTRAAAEHCIEDLRGSGCRVNLSIEEAHV